METLSTICDVIVLIGAVCAAIAGICSFFGKPIAFFQKRSRARFNKQFAEQMDEQLPTIIQNNSENLASNITKQIVDEINPKFEAIQQENQNQSAQLNWVIEASKDSLRGLILDLYWRNESTQSLSSEELRLLERYWTDYRAQNGNSEIAHYYNRMKDWDIRR